MPMASKMNKVGFRDLAQEIGKKRFLQQAYSHSATGHRLEQLLATLRFALRQVAADYVQDFP